MAILPSPFDSKSERRLRRRGNRRAGDTKPAAPVAGDIWFETDTNTLWVFNGTAWQSAGGGGGGGVTDHGALTGLADDDHTQYQKESEKGVASGYASLDGGTKVPTAQLGGGTASSSTYLRGDQTWATLPAGVTDHGALTGLADNDHTQYQLRSEKGVASGYVGMNGSGFAVVSQLGSGAPDSTMFLGATDLGNGNWRTLLDSDIPSTIARDAEVATAVSNHAGLTDPHTGYQKESEKGVASGYASLDAGTKVPTAQLGSGTADATTYLRGDQTWATLTAGHTHDGTGGATSLVIGGTAEGGAAIPVASSVGSIAIGDFANAGTGTQPIAIGTGVNATAAPSATGQGSIAMGASNSATVNGARASGNSSIAIGSGTSNATEVGALASGFQSIAIGQTASATFSRAIAIGSFAATSNGNGITIGGGSNPTSAPQVSNGGGIALGAGDGLSIAGARAGLNAIAIGSGNTLTAAASATSARAIAFGLTASAGSVQGIAIGAFAVVATGNGPIAIGGGSSATMAASATGQTSIAMGGSDATGVSGARATGAQSVAIGGGDATTAGASATHSNSIVFGKGAASSAVNQIMMGTTSHEVNVPGTIKIPTGAGVGKVLTSDINGVGSWATPAGGGGSADFEPVFWMGGF